MSDKVEMPDDADCRNCSDSDPGAWHALDKHCWNAASEESQRLIETEALLPASGGPERDYEPVTPWGTIYGDDPTAPHWCKGLERMQAEMARFLP